MELVSSFQAMYMNFSQMKILLKILYYTLFTNKKILIFLVLRNWDLLGGRGRENGELLFNGGRDGVGRDEQVLEIVTMFTQLR